MLQNHTTYFVEKAYFAGGFVCWILYGTPETPPPTCPSICVHLVRPICSRDRHRGVPSMHGRADLSRPPQRGARQMGTCILHRGHILARDRTHRDVLQHIFHFLY